MRPTPIPDAEVWEGATRIVVSPPNGDLTNPDIAPVEALADRSPSTGHPTLSVRCVLEDDDLELLQLGGTVWLTFWGRMVPWAVTVLAPMPGPASVTRVEKRTPNTTNCPDERHEHVWRRRRPELTEGTDQRLAYVAAADGTTQLTEEALSQLLRMAGFTPEETR